MPGPVPQYPIPLTPEQEGQLPHLSTCYTAPFADVQRARLLLFAPQHPPWGNAEIARRVGCWVQTVQHWRQRGRQTNSGRAAPRAGTRRPFTPLQRAQMTALAWSAPRAHGKPWPRWSGEKLAQVASEQPIVAHIAPGTRRPWLRQDQSKPWR
jgi:hypothetical protein